MKQKPCGLSYYQKQNMILSKLYSSGYFVSYLRTCQNNKAHKISFHEFLSFL